MPIYTYVCPDGSRVEAVRTVSERREAPCPGGRLVPSRVAVHAGSCRVLNTPCLPPGEWTEADADRMGLRPVEPGTDRDVERASAERQRRLGERASTHFAELMMGEMRDRGVTAEQFWRDLPAHVAEQERAEAGDA